MGCQFLWFLDEAFPADRAPLAEEFAQRLPRDGLKSINIDTVDIGAHTWHPLLGELEHLEEIRVYLYGSFFSQPLTQPIIALVKVRKWTVEEKDMPETRFD